MILLLLFSISSTIRASNTQTQITIIALCSSAKTVGRMKCNNAAENYKNKNSRIFWLDQNMKNNVNSQEMLCNKISENPRNSKSKIIL